MLDNLNHAEKCIFLIGNPIKHSISPQIHNAALTHAKLPYIYKKLEIETQVLKKTLTRLRKRNTIGFNVTIPYKIEILSYLDEISPVALEIGSVNTVKNINGYLIGTNTDLYGIKQALEKSKFKITQDQTIVIIGAGGTARSVAYYFSKYKLRLIILNRTCRNAELLVDSLSHKSSSSATLEFHELYSPKSPEYLKIADLIINCTPVGMWPDIRGDIIPKYTPCSKQWIFDLVYNPLETVLVKKAQKIGCNIISGLDMLIYQAAEAFKWWTNVVPDVKLMRKVAINSLNSIFSK